MFPFSTILDFRAVKNIFINISAAKSKRAFIYSDKPPFSGPTNPTLPVADVLRNFL